MYCTNQRSKPGLQKMGCNQILCLFLILLFSSATSTCFAAKDENRVSMSVYYETLCPFCAKFIVRDLVKLFDTGLIDVVDLRMIPWGNAVTDSDGSVVCQHGEKECFLNEIEACTISLYPEVEQQFGFIFCIENMALDGESKKWTDCFETAGLAEEKNPMDCYKSGHGKEIQEEYAHETANLNPPHTFVPWVVVNDQPLEDDYRNFTKYICDAYEGSHMPDACTDYLKHKVRNSTAITATEERVPAPEQARN